MAVWVASESVPGMDIGELGVPDGMFSRYWEMTKRNENGIEKDAPLNQGNGKKRRKMGLRRW